MVELIFDADFKSTFRFFSSCIENHEKVHFYVKIGRFSLKKCWKVAKISISLLLQISEFQTWNLQFLPSGDFLGAFSKISEFQTCNLDRKNIRDFKPVILAKWRFLGCFSQISEFQIWNLWFWPDCVFWVAFSEISDFQIWNLQFWSNGDF